MWANAQLGEAAAWAPAAQVPLQGATQPISPASRPARQQLLCSVHPSAQQVRASSQAATHADDGPRWTSRVGASTTGNTSGGGDTRDTGLPMDSTGAKLCVQPFTPCRTVFPAGVDACH